MSKAQLPSVEGPPQLSNTNPSETIQDFGDFGVQPKTAKEGRKRKRDLNRSTACSVYATKPLALNPAP